MFSQISRVNIPYLFLHCNSLLLFPSSQALFRGVTMMVPDRQIIMKVKLAACGYQEVSVLGRKELHLICFSIACGCLFHFHNSLVDSIWC